MKSKELEAIIQSFGKVIEESVGDPDNLFKAMFGDTSSAEEPKQAKAETKQPEHMLSLVDHKGNVVGMISRDYILDELIKKRG